MSEWEALEFELSRLYALLSGSPNDVDVMQIYGTGTIFRERANMLDQIGKAYFMANCGQAREGDFDKLLVLARNYSARRNDIAHGIVFRVNDITFFRQRIRPDRLHRNHYILIPPLYAKRSHSTGLPDFAYTSTEMHRIQRRIENLRMEIRRYLKSFGVAESLPKDREP